MNIKHVIERAFSRSVSRMQAFYVSAWAHDPILEIVNHTGVSASIIQKHDLIVQVSTGCAIAIHQLHKNCSATPDLDCALEWLILHEFHHATLSHFELMRGTPFLHLVSRSKREAIPLDDLPKNMHDKIASCLELQADHEALEMMLDDYAVSEWDEMRMQAASIAAVMVLVEKADAENAIEHSTHPKAATRIFQILGHVAEMWSIPAHAKAKARGEETIRDEDLPSENELHAFSKEVILPAFWDAVALAKAAGAESLIADLGSPEDFFADIGRAKLGQWDELVTAGAKEWAELKDMNSIILKILEKF
jgi:hypothetical protein